MNTNISKYRKLKSRKGFSLIELLVVIAVIGIIAAIAIPNIGNLTGSAETARNQRNAQTVASVSSAAMAAGHVPAQTDTAEITALIGGVPGPAVDGSSFKVDITMDDFALAQEFLTYTPTGGFSYHKDGAPTPP